MPGGNEVASLFVTVGADTGGFERGMRNVQGTAQGVGSTLRNLALAAGAALGGAQIVNAALGFDRSMANIRAVTGRTADEMAALQSEIIKIGSASTVGPQAVADAFYDIAGGVADASTHMAILDAAIATSEAGQADLTATTGGMIAAMNAYGLGADDAMTVSDLFTRTVGVGVGTMDEFVAAMSPVFPTMASAGVGLDEFTGMMAYMTTKGVNASMSATQLRQATIALLNPNKAMSAALRQAGIQSGSMALQQRGLKSTLAAVRMALGGNVDAMAEALGSAEALNAGLILTEGQFEDLSYSADFSNFFGSFIDGATGATEAARALQLESVSAQFDRLKSNLEGLALSVGTALLPALGEIVQFGVDALNAIITKGPEIVAGIVAWFGGTQIGQDIARAAENLQPHIQRFADIIGQTINTLLTGQGATDWLPMYLVTPEGFQEVPPPLLNRIQTFFDSLLPAIVESASGIIDKLAEEIGRIGTNVVDSLTNFVNGLTIPQPVKDVIDTVLMPLRDAFARLSEINWNNIVIAAGVVVMFVGGLKGLGMALSLLKGMVVFDLVIRGLQSLDQIVASFKSGDAAGVLEGIGGALLFFGGALVITNIGPLLAGLVTGLTGIQTIAVAGGPLVTGLYAVGTAIGALLGPIALVTIAVSGLTIALLALMRTRDEAANSLRNFKSEFSDPFYLRMLNEGQPFQGSPTTITNPMAFTPVPEMGITNPFPAVVPPPRDSGGPVIGGRAYKVGVPELFIPSNSGTAIPLSQLGGGGGGVTIPVTVTLDSKVLYQAVVKEDTRRNNKWK